MSKSNSKFAKEVSGMLRTSQCSEVNYFGHILMIPYKYHYIVTTHNGDIWVFTHKPSLYEGGWTSIESWDRGHAKVIDKFVHPIENWEESLMEVSHND